MTNLGNSLLDAVAIAVIGLYLWERFHRKSASKKPVRPKKAPLREEPKSPRASSIPPPPPPRVDREAELRQQLDEAVDLEDVLDVIRKGPPSSVARSQAISKALTLIEERLNMALDLDAVIRILQELHELPANVTEVLQQKAAAKGRAFARTAEDYIALYGETSDNQSLEAALQLCSSASDFQSLYEALPDDDLLRKQFEKKVEAFYADKIAKATDSRSCLDLYAEMNELEVDGADSALDRGLALAGTRKECLEIAETLEDEDEIGLRVLRKALGLSQTTEERIEVYEEAARFSDQSKDLDLFLKESLEKAETVEECISIFLAGDDQDTELSDEILDKTIRLAHTAEELERIREELEYHIENHETFLLKEVSVETDLDALRETWNEWGFDSPIGQAAVCRAADLIRRQAA